ncbi:MAG: hypothetical protein IPG24_09630 [Leptospiraceae bacterium]|nr:hypothetical protein [Leptospiraceae bacterium]
MAQCTSVDIKSKVEPTASVENSSGKSKKAAEEDLTKQEKAIHSKHGSKKNLPSMFL